MISACYKPKSDPIGNKFIVFISIFDCLQERGKICINENDLSFPPKSAPYRCGGCLYMWIRV
jgi:hypothetical protein